MWSVVSLARHCAGSLKFGIYSGKELSPFFFLKNNIFIEISFDTGCGLHNRAGVSEGTPRRRTSWLSFTWGSTAFCAGLREVAGFERWIVCHWLQGDPPALAKLTASLRILQCLIFWYNGHYYDRPTGSPLTTLMVIMTKRWRGGDGGEDGVRSADKTLFVSLYWQHHPWRKAPGSPYKAIFLCLLKAIIQKAT